MRRTMAAASALAVLPLLLVAAGCGSNSTPSAIDQVLEPRIQEYVGDGGGSLKPWPGLIPRAVGDRPMVVGPKLKWVAGPKADKVARKQVSWYRLQASKGLAQSWIVTVQPTANENADLYVLEGRGSDFADGMDLIGSSRRAPQAAGVTGSGYAPDWVSVPADASAGWPVAYVAVLGVNEVPAVKHYRVELDFGVVLTPNGAVLNGALPRHSSDWYVLSATPGSQYTVTVTPLGGDPDVFIYGKTSSDYIGGDTGTGTATLPFTATADLHWVRVYGWDALSTYDIQLTSP